MQVAPVPHDEAFRLKNLFSYEIMDSAEEKDFDDLAELVAQVCNCQYGLIVFLDKERQWFKARRQVEIKETSRDISFCSHTILQDDVMIVYDMKKDKRFFDNPFFSGYYIRDLSCFIYVFISARKSS